MQLKSKATATPNLVGAIAMGGIPDDENISHILPDGSWS